VNIMTTPKVYTVEEVAEMMKVHPRTVYRMLDQGKIKGFKFGAAWRITQAEVDAMMRGERADGGSVPPAS
jgi:excisionase family DNA binding protein